MITVSATRPCQYRVTRELSALRPGDGIELKAWDPGVFGTARCGEDAVTIDLGSDVDPRHQLAAELQRVVDYFTRQLASVQAGLLMPQADHRERFLRLLAHRSLALFGQYETLAVDGEPTAVEFHVNTVFQALQGLVEALGVDAE